MPITDTDQLDFAVFCIESVAEVSNVNPSVVYDALARRSHLLNDYVVQYYDVLHTQDKYYIADDILRKMSDEGVAL